eukprot:m51a1_g634 hypothetical protein (197) ;mRNA; r:154969-155870
MTTLDEELEEEKAKVKALDHQAGRSRCKISRLKRKLLEARQKIETMKDAEEHATAALKGELANARAALHDVEDAVKKTAQEHEAKDKARGTVEMDHFLTPPQAIVELEQENARIRAELAQVTGSRNEACIAEPGAPGSAKSEKTPGREEPLVRHSLDLQSSPYISPAKKLKRRLSFFSPKKSPTAAAPATPDKTNG